MAKWTRRERRLLKASGRGGKTPGGTEAKAGSHTAGSRVMVLDDRAAERLKRPVIKFATKVLGWPRARAERAAENWLREYESGAAKFGS